MAVANSSIEWTESTWSPVTGCTKISAGCDNCYAEGIARRFAGSKAFPNGFEVTLHPQRLDQPLKWRKPRRIFVNSMSDLFHDAVPDEYIARVWAVMALASRHTFQVLTKRHRRMRSLLSSSKFRHLCEEAQADLIADKNTPFPQHVRDWKTSQWWSDFTFPLRNVWLGVSVESQRWADIRIPVLLRTPAAVRFISAEPLLGPVDITQIRDWCPTHDKGTDFCVGPCPDRRGLDWVIVGGESGPGARPMHPDWARSLRDQCASAGVPYFMKQAGAVLAKEWGCSDRKGHNPSEWPETFPREYPNA